LSDDGDDERRTLELLEANHDFPGDYPLTVIAFNRDDVTEIVLRAIEEEVGAPVPAEGRSSRLSAGGKYASHRLSVPCRAAADVVRLYARLRGIDGVVSVL